MAVIDFRNPNSRFSLDDDYDDDDFEEEDDGQSFIDEEIEDSENTWKRRREILRLILHWAGIAAALVVFLAVVLFLASQRVYSGYSVSTVMEMSSQDDTSYTTLGSNVVYYSKDGASCINAGGNVVWSVSYEMQKPLVSRAGDILAIGDYNGSTIYLQNASETLGTINTNMPIAALSASESGEVAAVLMDTDVTWVYLFDKEGNTIAYFKTTMSQSGYPVSVSVSPSGELVCVSHLLTGSTGVTSSIAFYNFGDVGQNVAENNVSGFNYDNEIFPVTAYLSDSVCAAVSDSRIAFFTGKQIPASGNNALFTNEVKAVYTGDGYIGILFADEDGDQQYELRIYDASGEVAGTIMLDEDFTNIQIVGKAIYVNNDSSLSIYTVGGKERYSGEFDDTVRAVIPRKDTIRKLYLATDTGIEQMTLR
jgi:hypothetical protein